MPLMGQIEARRDDLAPTPVYHFAHLLRPLVHEQDEEDRRGMVERDPLRHGLQHHRLSRLGRRHDQRALAKAQRADQIDDALDLGRARAGRPGGLESQGARWVHGTELREVGPLGQGGGRQPVDAQHAPVLDGDEIAAPQSGETHAGIALGRQITVGGDAYGAAVGGGVEPAGDGRQYGPRCTSKIVASVVGCQSSGLMAHDRALYFSPTCAKITSATSVSWPISTTGTRPWPTASLSSRARWTSA